MSNQKPIYTYGDRAFLFQGNTDIINDAYVSVGIELPTEAGVGAAGISLSNGDHTVSVSVPIAAGDKESFSLTIEAFDNIVDVLQGLKLQLLELQEQYGLHPPAANDHDRA